MDVGTCSAEAGETCDFMGKLRVISSSVNIRAFDFGAGLLCTFRPPEEGTTGILIVTLSSSNIWNGCDDEGCELCWDDGCGD